MKGIRIVSTGKALPVKKVSNDDLSKLVETNDEWITTRTGISNRYKCEEESSLTLAISAGAKALEKSGVAKEEIGAVIVATSTSEYIFPSTACMVAKELGLDEEVASFDISAACTGFLYGLQIANGMINTMDKKYLLLIGSEKLSQIVDYTDRSTCILFGDGAGAAVIGPSDSKFVQKSWSRGNIEALSCKGVGQQSFIQMKGSDVFKFAVTALQQAITEVLDKAGYTLDDIDYVVCHQANARIIDHVKKKFPEYADKFYVNIKDYGNTSAASIPIALDEVLTANEGNKRLLLVGFGAGLTWSGAIIER